MTLEQTADNAVGDLGVSTLARALKSNAVVRALDLNSACGLLRTVEHTIMARSSLRRQFLWRFRCPHPLARSLGEFDPCRLGYRTSRRRYDVWPGWRDVHRAHAARKQLAYEARRQRYGRCHPKAYTLRVKKCVGIKNLTSITGRSMGSAGMTALAEVLRNNSTLAELGLQGAHG